MELIKAKYEILTKLDGNAILKDIELAARTCYKSEHNINNGSAAILIGKLIKRGHDAMLEFGESITVRFTVDRGISHELVRHRLASFAQESTRYCTYKDYIEFIIPNWFDEQDIVDYNNNAIPMTSPFYIWIKSMLSAEQNYNDLLVLGWSAQQARSVLPNSLKTEIVVKANIREWRHILKLRVAKSAHPQMREVMIPLLAELKDKIPVLFDDIKLKK